MKRHKFLIFLTSVCFLIACVEPSLPKQHAYPRINFPKHSYAIWNQTEVPYTFEKPIYCLMIPDTAGAFWYNLNFTPFNATLHLSFQNFNTLEALDTLIRDSRNLAYKHTVKANDIIDMEIKDSSGRSGMYFLLEGETATPFNFYLTDNKSKFFRGALYFNSYTTIDSVSPVVDFIKKDIGQMIKSFRFKP